MESEQKPIDILLLETLRDAIGPMTADELSKQWGEDVFRVSEWLHKFAKLGLVDFGSTEDAAFAWFGRPSRIVDYLESKNSR